ncbi:MAG: hypothetical protein K9J12_15695 [Melioribacteraceae bacterium]|nr:hypothetical protein [Melioribacteraceae bacterium]MCF8264900.1 hypothetical protein [Melioribacteraceae bacterium]MCF8414130.1 hypothetical protein [Melioribacteraceae bacterium]MCF8432169.1 hypothetical protein [Melioribacteraceae bacterium]
MNTIKVYKIIKDDKVVFKGILREAVKFFKEIGFSKSETQLRVGISTRCNMKDRTFQGYVIESDEMIPFKGSTKSKVQ